jgi:hypothetical protein
MNFRDFLKQGDEAESEVPETGAEETVEQPDSEESAEADSEETED